MYLGNAIYDILKSFLPILTFFTEEENPAMLHKEVDLNSFYLPGCMKDLNWQEITSEQLWENMDSTKKFHKELDPQRKRWEAKAI